MKQSYSHRIDSISLAILDVVDCEDGVFHITRISVPEKHRGRGFGSKVLRECTEDADRESVTLSLEVLTSGDMTEDDLRAWYARHGFVPYMDVMYREPKKLRRSELTSSSTPDMMISLNRRRS